MQTNSFVRASPEKWATQAETTRANFETRYPSHAYLQDSVPQIGKRAADPLPFPPAKVESIPLNEDEESFNYGSRGWASQCGVVARMPSVLTSQPASQTDAILQFANVCGLQYDPHSGVFHLNSHGFVGCRRAKLSLTNQCLPWHPKAA